MRQLPNPERIWESIVNNIPDGIVLVRAHGLVLLANSQACRQSGCTPQEIEGRDYGANLPESVCAIRLQHIELALKNQSAVRWNDQVGDTHYSLTAIPIKDSEDLILVSRDVTDQDRLRESEQNKRARLKTLIETLPDLVWLQDTAGNYVNCNHKFERFLGASENALKGKRAVDFMPPDLAESFNLSFTQAITRNKAVVTREWITYASDGRSEFSEIIHTPFIDQNGILMGVMGIARDVTAFKQNADNLRRHRDQLEQLVSERNADLSRAVVQLKRAQSDLIEAEKLASLGHVVAGISHELNTPIGVIVTASSSIMQEHADFSAAFSQGLIKRSTLKNRIDRDDEMLELIFRSATRAATLLDNFKKVSTEQTSEHRRVFDVRDIVTFNLDALMPAFKNLPIEIINEVPTGINCDSYPGQLGQIVTNVVQNSFIHGFEGRENGHIFVNCDVGDETIVLRISDDGIGMDATTLMRIFDPFFTTKLGKGGSGLGMSICKRIANSILGGDLTVTSTPGIGSTFELTLLREASGSNLVNEWVEQ